MSILGQFFVNFRYFGGFQHYSRDSRPIFRQLYAHLKEYLCVLKGNSEVVNFLQSSFGGSDFFPDLFLISVNFNLSQFHGLKFLKLQTWPNSIHGRIWLLWALFQIKVQKRWVSKCKIVRRSHLKKYSDFSLLKFSNYHFTKLLFWHIKVVWNCYASQP